MNPVSMARARTVLRRAPVIIAGALVVLVPVQFLAGVLRDETDVSVSEPLPVVVRGPGLPDVPLVPTVRPTFKSPEPTPTPEPAPRLEMFGGLGAWVDLFDFEDLDPVASVTDMAARGVRTLYLQTGRYNTPDLVDPLAGPWLAAAHDAGLGVVGWYLPGYRRMSKELRRTVAIATYDYAGHRFDALGIDVEYKGIVRDPPRWNARVVEHAEAVRDALGAEYPIAAIVPPPLQMDVAPLMWAGFPWKDLAEPSDVIMLMSYWSFRDCPKVPDHCALPFTQKNIEITRALIGVDGPIHVIGGVGDSVNGRQIEDFVAGAVRAEAFGASIYDYRTTKPKFWASLAKLTSL